MFYLYGESEPEGVGIVRDPSEDEIPNHVASEIRHRHASRRRNQRDITIMEFGVDHGLGAHAGNGSAWRTAPVAMVSLDYLKNSPIVYARIHQPAIELLSEFAQAVAIQQRKV